MDLQTQRLMEGAAGVSGGPVGINDIFKTYLVTGNGSSRSINTGIDMTGGGLVWSKARSWGVNNTLIDSERGGTAVIHSDDSGASSTESTAISSFNNNGYSVGSYNLFNDSSVTYVHHSFKKQKKFFTIKTYTGTGSTQSLSHDLDAVPGAIFVKRTDTSADWAVYHRRQANGTNPWDWRLKLNSNTTQNNDTYWGDTAPTASAFTVGDAHAETNASGGTYVAYLFAHEETAFGPNEDQKIISCGSYYGSGSSSVDVTNVGFEPQWVLIKNITYSSNWVMFDAMRGVPEGQPSELLYANDNSSENNHNVNFLNFTKNGFKVNITGNSEMNQSGSTHIYIAIAAETGKTMSEITTGSDVFAMDTGGSSSNIPNFDSGFPVDFAIAKNPGAAADWYTGARKIQGKYVRTNLSNAEGSSASFVFDSSTGWQNDSGWGSSIQSWMFRRHAGFDVQTVTTTGSGYQFISHGLGVAPEMVFMKKRDGTSDWHVWHKDLNGGTTPFNWSLHLNDSSAEWESSGYMWGLNNNPSATWVIILDSYFGGAGDYLMVLFASVKSVCHVGSYDGSSSSQTITIPNGGFQPRFVLIKRATGVGQWSVLDTTRGWVSGNDKLLELSDSGAQQTNTDWGAPTSTGFTVNSGISAINNNGDRYIYYAHA